MPLHILRNDITRMQVDAIVNAVDPTLSCSGGVDGAIRRAAGSELEQAILEFGNCRPGSVKITPGFNLPCRYVIHTAGSIWFGGLFGERHILTACYRNALALAADYGCRSIAFPVISAGSFAFPKQKAIDIAVTAIRSFLKSNDMTVFLVIYDREDTGLDRRSSLALQKYLDDQYTKTFDDTCYPSQARNPIVSDEALDFSFSGDGSSFSGSCHPSACTTEARAPDRESFAEFQGVAPARTQPAASQKAAKKTANISPDDFSFQIDESFQQMLLRKIDEKGMTDAQCYKKANVDRKLFSKIRKDIHYKPSKPTAIAFAVALELDLNDSEDLLRKAGFALSRSSIFDLIIRYYIEHGCYDIYEINEALYRYDQNLLGA